MKPFYALFISIGLAIVGQILMKSAMLKIGEIDLRWGNLLAILWKIFSHSTVLLGLLFFGLSAFLWLVALSKVKLSVAYPMVAITYVAIPVLSLKYCSMNEHSLKEDILNILRILSSDGNFTQRDLSTHLGFSLGKTNYLIKELAKKGLVKIKNFSHKDHKLKRISYILTTQGLKQKTELTLHFLKRKQQEYENLRREWENLERLSAKESP